MRKVVSEQERIATRAYYYWLNGMSLGAEEDWFEAEMEERTIAFQKRQAAARKGVATKNAKAVTTAALKRDVKALKGMAAH